MTTDTAPSILTRPDGTPIAYHHLPGKSPGVLFCGGYMSDMTGTKAMALEQACRAAGRAYTRFDYRGHGQSGGAFVDGTIGLWADDAMAVLDLVTEGPQIVVGSSMGGWIMLLLARARPERLAGLVGIAAAPDFVLRMWDEFSDEIKETLQRDGVYYEPSQYSDDPYPYTMKLIEDGRRNLVLQDGLKVDCPVRLLQGMRDPDVPWQEALAIVDKVDADDITATLVKNGDHRLSEPGDIDRLLQTVATLAEGVAAN